MFSGARVAHEPVVGEGNGGREGQDFGGGGLQVEG